jgi:YD repeat-containing protein
LITETDPLSRTTTTSYDLAGQQVTKTDANAVTTICASDGAHLSWCTYVTAIAAYAERTEIFPGDSPELGFVAIHQKHSVTGLGECKGRRQSYA